MGDSSSVAFAPVGSARIDRPSEQGERKARSDRSVPGRAKQYLPHIDGLRAFAVLAVVLHHAAPTWVPGGFLGVDVFFVISGYLITAIVAGELTSGCFGIRAFYLRRIRRLMPALVVVLSVVLMLALLILTPQELVSSAKHSLAALLFYSNILLAAEVGYFDVDALNKPLLHLCP